MELRNEELTPMLLSLMELSFVSLTARLSSEIELSFTDARSMLLSLMELSFVVPIATRSDIAPGAGERRHGLRERAVIRESRGPCSQTLARAKYAHQVGWPSGSSIELSLTEASPPSVRVESGIELSLMELSFRDSTGMELSFNEAMPASTQVDAAELDRTQLDRAELRALHIEFQERGVADVGGCVADVGTTRAGILERFAPVGGRRRRRDRTQLVGPSATAARLKRTRAPSRPDRPLQG